MRSSVCLLFASLVALAGCGQASGSVPDPSSDLHCSVIAFYFSGLAEHDGAPADQRRALAAVHEWYAAKLRQLATQRGDPNSVLAEAEPILDAIKRDPRAMLDEHETCSERAMADPAFNRFVGTLS